MIALARLKTQALKISLFLSRRHGGAPLLTHKRLVQTLKTKKQKKKVTFFWLTAIVRIQPTLISLTAGVVSSSVDMARNVNNIGMGTGGALLSTKRKENNNSIYNCT